MLRDVFYYGAKPNVHPRERSAVDLEDARQKATTRDFWIINEYCDYRNFDWDFDFEFLPDEDVWAEDHNNVWPSQHQKDSGTWLCPKEHSDIIIYRGDVDPIYRKNEKQSDNWVEVDLIDHKKFDFSWHPDPTDPPYIYKWGCKYYPAQFKHVLEYRVPGATQEKYMDAVVELLPDWDKWQVPANIDKTKFDFAWRPDPMDPALIYEFGTQWQRNGGPVYTAPGAVDIKYCTDQKAVASPDASNWHIPGNIDPSSFDFSWHPDRTSPPYKYVFATQWAMSGGPVYEVAGATDIKYVEAQQATALPDMTNWVYDETEIDVDSFDFSWHPYAADEPYIYQFGTQWQKTGGPKYVMPGAEQVKYIDTRILQATRLSNKNSNWLILNYTVEEFDWSWHPDDTEEPYLYVFGNTQYPAEECPTIMYNVAGSSEPKYVHDNVAKLAVDMSKWEVPENVDTTGFDFSWIPNPSSPPYIYEFATQWQKTGGPRYIVPGATEKTYTDAQKVKRLPSLESWTIPGNIDPDGFDFSWHPDDTNPPYTYVFATQWAFSGGPVYNVDGAHEVKYVEDQVAVASVNMDNWEYDADLIDVDAFDFSWHPHVEDQPYVYQFGTQWQKTGGPKYITPGADESSPIKYIDTRIQKAIRKPNTQAWKTNYAITDFDWSWHPDDTDEPYVYQFGNNLYPAEECPTVEYIVDGATQVKYVDTLIATLGPDMNNWEIPSNVSEEGFDFSWVPNPKDPPYIYEFATTWNNRGGPRYVVPGATEFKYIEDVKALTKFEESKWEIPEDIDTDGFDFTWVPHPDDPLYTYEFGTQWQKTGGPKYIVDGATEKKYVEFQKVKKLPSMERWTVPENIDQSLFDFSWHPDASSPPYVYVFATQWAFSGGPVYTVPGASETKYIDELTATAVVDMANWVYDDTVMDVSEFDFSWHPHVEDQPYVYQFGTQWQKTGGPRYIVPGADSSSPVKYIDTRIQKAIRKPNSSDAAWHTLMAVKEFDYSWHPDDTDEQYVYQFGNSLYPAEECPTVEYRVSGATQVKYVHDVVAILDTSMDNWDIPDNIDPTSFDFSWIPNPKEPAFIYEFGTQWQKTSGPKYVVPGAVEKKYVALQKATRLPSNPIDPNWVVPDNVDATGFDFSWHPDDTSPPYNYVFATQWAMSGGPEYRVPGATEIKYVDVQQATALPNRENWVYDDSVIDAESFDFSWHPYAADDPYVYQFGTQWWETGGPKYVAPGASLDSPVKYIDTRVLKALIKPNKTNWEIPDNVDSTGFDFTWVPHPESPPYIYQFGTQWQKTGGPRYVVPGATEVSYVDPSVLKAKRLPCMDNWETPDTIVVDTDKFDFSWHPDDLAPAYIYQFDTQWALRGGPRYVVPGATEVSYVEDIVVDTGPCMTNWDYDPELIDAEAFDFSWHPYEDDKPYIYQFGTQWQKTGGPKYVVPGAEQVKYIDPRILKARRLPNRSAFTVLGGAKVKDFDWSWHPDDTSPPYLYQFGNNWYDAEEMPTVEYAVEGATEAKFVTDIIATLAPSKNNWVIPEGVNVNKFDFSWIPHPSATPYTYQFGTSDNPLDGPVYVTPGSNGETINVPRVELDTEEDSVLEILEVEEVVEERPAQVVSMDMFFVDKGNPESAARFEALKAKFGPHLQKTRYLNSWVDTINRCVNRSTTPTFWVLNSELDYSNFTFEYYPNMWQMKMVHVFGTQWSHWGSTFMINKETFPNDTKWIKIIEHLSNLNFVKDMRARATSCLYDIVLIDHGNKETDRVAKQIASAAPDKTLTVVKYDDSYLNTLRNYVKKLPERKEHYLWICSSVCDYSQFDFSYICDPFSKDNLHVFPSGTQKFGDTFLVDINKTREIIDEMEKLEDYHKVNYNNAVRTSRLPEPIIITKDDTHINSINNVTGFPYATLITTGDENIESVSIEPMNLWAPDTKNIIVTSTGATRIIVPSEAKDYVQKELYDYPYIKRAPKLAKSNPLDIVFLSNGEAGADENWEHLLKTTEGLPNRVVRVDGVNGRAAAYHAAAEASNTPWMFTVFAKLKVSPKFDWNWQPDRMQVPKHYIFHAKNPVTGLIYGHQAMIAYNKKLTLANEGRGLDFTLDDEHETVPLISGTAHYNTDPFSTWRTAFREVLKLKADDSEESRVRLDAWLNKGEGDFGQFSIKGALDADEYYDEVDGDFDALKLSYEWAWLRDRFDNM